MRRFLICVAVGGYSVWVWADPATVHRKETPAETKARGTSHTFDEEDIAGKRRDPLGSLIKRNQVDMKTDLIQLRTDWNEKIEDSLDQIGSVPPVDISSSSP